MTEQNAQLQLRCESLIKQAQLRNERIEALEESLAEAKGKTAPKPALGLAGGGKVVQPLRGGRSFRDWFRSPSRDTQ